MLLSPSTLSALSLHDALPISFGHGMHYCLGAALARQEGEVAFTQLLNSYPDLSLVEGRPPRPAFTPGALRDRKSTRLNSSHVANSYAVFCSKRKKAGHNGSAA